MSVLLRLNFLLPEIKSLLHLIFGLHKVLQVRFFFLELSNFPGLIFDFRLKLILEFDKCFLYLQ